MPTKYLLLLYLTVQLIACNNKGSNYQGLSVNKIDTNTAKTYIVDLSGFDSLKIPYFFKFNASDSDNYLNNMDSFLMSHGMKISENEKLNSLFSNLTEDFLDTQKKSCVFPYDGKGYLIGRFAFNNDSFHTLLFYYNSQSDDCMSHRFELQTFDNSDFVISKLIVGDLSVCGECFIKREFSIDKKSTINVSTFSSCLDEETQKSKLIKEEYAFMITETGIINQKK